MNPQNMSGWEIDCFEQEKYVGDHEEIECLLG